MRILHGIFTKQNVDGYCFSIGAILILRRLIPLCSEENAMSAISPLRETMVPTQNWGCFIFVPTVKSAMSLFLALEVREAIFEVPAVVEPAVPLEPNPSTLYFPALHHPEN